MISPSIPARRCRVPFRAPQGGFTLIELLAVITIILILAGLLLNIAGSAQYKAAFARATSEIKQMETAMESYKADNGAYPRPTTAGTGSDLLNAQTSSDPAAATAPTYITVSQFLFTQLSGIATGTAPTTKIYINFLPGQLITPGAAGTLPTGGSTYIIDPFGFSYGYSTANQYAQDQNNANPGAVNASQFGYNPTFDLWSTGGYATGGKSYTSTSLSATQYNTLWAKNW